MSHDFRSDLKRTALDLAPYRGAGAGAFHSVKIRPSLSFSLVPRPRKQRTDKDSQWGDEQRKRARIAAVLAGPQGRPAGLVDGAKSDAFAPNRNRRKGLAGLSAAGGLAIEDLCALIRQDRGCYAMWTVTLPVEAAKQLDRIKDGWQQFQDKIRRRFNEELVRSCRRESQQVRALVVAVWGFVVEPQQSGRPHMHFVFRCKARRGRRWLLGKGRLDRLIRSALKAVTGKVHSSHAAGNVQALRSTPGAYLSKYLRKGSGRNGAEAILAGGWSENLIPHQWWGWSRTALEMVRNHTTELPSQLVGWLSLLWPELQAMGHLKAKIWQPDAEGAPAIVVGRWRDFGQLKKTIDDLVQWMHCAYADRDTKPIGA